MTMSINEASAEIWVICYDMDFDVKISKIHKERLLLGLYEEIQILIMIFYFIRREIL